MSYASIATQSHLIKTQKLNSNPGLISLYISAHYVMFKARRCSLIKFALKRSTMATVSMVSEKRPRVVLWPRLEPFEFGILHCQDRGAIAKLNVAVRMLSLQLTRTLICAVFHVV